jgi:hypothetical protein
MTGWIRFLGPVYAALGAWMLNEGFGGPIYYRGGQLPTPVWIFLSSGLLLGGVAMTASAFTARFAISADSIEIGSAIAKKKLALDAIRGRRQYATGSGRLTKIHFKLEPKGIGLTALTFQNNFNFDDQFWLWFNQLPDLDLEESPSDDEVPAR